MFSEFVTVNGVGVKGSDLIYGLVEGDVVLKGGDNILNGIEVSVRNMIAVDYEGGVFIEYGFTVALLGVVVAVIFLGFGHSSPPIEAIV